MSVGLAALALHLLGPALASDVPVGDWTTDGLTPEEQARVEEGVQAAVAGLTAVARPIAREALRRASRPCDRVRIQRQGEALSVQCDDLAPAMAVPGREGATWTGQDGRTHALTYETRPGEIVQRLVASRGTKTTRFVADGPALRAEVTIESRLLSGPISYTVIYRRPRITLHACDCVHAPPPVCEDR